MTDTMQIWDTMRIWDAVSETDPNYTKHVSQRGGFTAISANYQMMQATKQFGPAGIGWGYVAGDPIFQETLLFVPVTLWHGDRSNSFGPMLGCEEWKDRNGRVDSDASKKATTDAITKLLSQLGFSADVFLGRYDDQKYVESLQAKYAPKPAPLPTGPINDKTRDWLANKIDGTGVPVGDFCKEFEVTSLKAITYEQIEAAKAWVNEHRKAA
jgi:hypothetical protein